MHLNLRSAELRGGGDERPISGKYNSYSPGFWYLNWSVLTRLGFCAISLADGGRAGGVQGVCGTYARGAASWYWRAT